MLLRLIPGPIDTAPNCLGTEGRQTATLDTIAPCERHRLFLNLRRCSFALQPLSLLMGLGNRRFILFKRGLMRKSGACLPVQFIPRFVSYKSWTAPVDTDVIGRCTTSAFRSNRANMLRELLSTSGIAVDANRVSKASRESSDGQLLTQERISCFSQAANLSALGSPTTLSFSSAQRGSLASCRGLTCMVWRRASFHKYRDHFE
jgi:hypothetical protein